MAAFQNTIEKLTEVVLIAIESNTEFYLQKLQFQSIMNYHFILFWPEFEQKKQAEIFWRYIWKKSCLWIWMKGFSFLLTKAKANTILNHTVCQCFQMYTEDILGQTKSALQCWEWPNFASITFNQCTFMLWCSVCCMDWWEFKIH